MMALSGRLAIFATGNDRSHKDRTRQTVISRADFWGIDPSRTRFLGIVKCRVCEQISDISVA